MKVLQAWSKWIDGHGQYEDHWQIIGIGDDNKIHLWNYSTGKWSVYKSAPTKKTTKQLDDIPF